MTATRKFIYRLIELIIALLAVTWIITGIGTSSDNFMTHTVMPFSEITHIDYLIMAAILLTVLVGYTTLLIWEGMRGIFSINLLYNDPTLEDEALAKHLLEMKR